MKALILCGGISPERHVSLQSGLSVYRALQKTEHTPFLFDPSRGREGLLEEDLNFPQASKEVDPDFFKLHPLSLYLEAIESSLFDQIDIVFNVLHGPGGEDGHFQTLLELKGIPHIGSSAASSRICFDKWLTKTVLKAHHIKTPNGKLVHSLPSQEECLSMMALLGPKWIIKPNQSGSSLGISAVDASSYQQVIEAIKLASSYSKEVIIEELIKGRDILSPIICEKATDLVEIHSTGQFFDLEAKYNKALIRSSCPALLTQDIEEKLKATSLKAFHALGCSDYARLDYILDEQNTPYLLEVNTLPGLTSDSSLPSSVKSQNITFSKLCENLLNFCLQNSQ